MTKLFAVLTTLTLIGFQSKALQLTAEKTFNLSSEVCKLAGMKGDYVLAYCPLAITSSPYLTLVAVTTAPTVASEWTTQELSQQEKELLMLAADSAAEFIVHNENAFEDALLTEAMDILKPLQEKSGMSDLELAEVIVQISNQ